MLFEQRISVPDVDPEAFKPMIALKKYIHAGSLGEPLLALIKIRASQINDCAYCLDMHGREARAVLIASFTASSLRPGVNSRRVFPL
ncbi:carboxymuconolactone decarboxylase family protein [Cryobacterium sp. M15]|jgi:alkylhydroperoxidase family enzyme|uniref:carboxymuconolactone decarboxylase family protein n=1 Tax=Cryobacterium sp. M15 TaxID=2048291 RepID=UPI000CE3992F|nr:carboxymuconolactone decarboxylase family protein [Cryobacterium sp. M15]